MNPPTNLITPAIIPEPILGGKLVSYFKGPITNTSPLYDVSLEELHKYIISDQLSEKTAQLRAITDKKFYNQFKAENFDYATFNGTFQKRNEKGLKTPSGYFIIDVDHLGNNLKNFLDRIIADKILCPQLVFISPGGDGVKTIVKIDISLIDMSAKSKKMNAIWQAVNTYFSREYADLITPNEKNEFIDGSGKDISRACFIPHDPNAYLNLNDSPGIDSNFINNYAPIKKQQNETSIKVSPKTNLDKLAKKHLLQTGNHHPNVIAFASAASAIGTPISHTLNYLGNFVHISEKSSHADPGKLIKEVEDIYRRYNTDSGGVVFLTELSFGFDIVYFKYSTVKSSFLPSSLYWDKILQILQYAGFSKRKIGKGFIYTHRSGCIIKEVTPENMRDCMNNYINQINMDLKFTYQNIVYQIPAATVREIFLKNSNNIFNKTWLEHLQEDKDPILKDTSSEMYFCFRNCVVTITKEYIITKYWNEKTGFCVWEDQVIAHDFAYSDNITTSHFYNFLRNVTNHNEDRFFTMITGIGYLLHFHFSESEGQAVLLYDETITDTRTPQGGSGKGLIVNAIKQVRNVTKIDGKHLDPANRFKWEQVTPSTQITWLDDVKPDFDFSVLHSNLTDGWTVERKYLPQFTIKPADSPKTVICSNTIMKGGGSTNRRRQHIIELSDHYSKQIRKGDEKPIEREHGCIFFSPQWDSNQWNAFYNVMFYCGFQYMTNGFVSYVGVNVELNRFRQATSEDFATWVEDQKFELNETYFTKAKYEAFVGAFYDDNHRIAQRTFTGWIKEYAQYKGLNLELKPSNGISQFILRSI